MRIWIDTDLGSDVDDALALAYALKHPEIEVVGLSTVFGDVTLRSQIVRALLDLAVREVPVLTGLGKPLTDGRRGVMFGHEGKRLLEEPRPRLRVDEDPEAQQRTDAIAAALDRAQPDWLLAIGPMTNLGALARAGVTLPRLAIMGGKVADTTLAGMVDGIGEWNWFSDPEAVASVLDRGADPPDRIVPAEVTFQTALEPDEIERLAAGDALCRALHALSHEWLAAQRTLFQTDRPRVALHDPLTLATLVEPGLCEYQTGRITVDETGASPWTDGEANAQVATSVDVPALRRHLLDVWLG